MQQSLNSVDPDTCEEHQNVGYVNFALSVFILVGILVSYLPQHYRIIARRTSEGISPYFILLGTTSGTCSFANILVLSRSTVACCRNISAFECTAALLGIAQIGIQWTCFSIILLLFLIFFPRNAAPQEVSIIAQSSWRNAMGVAILCLVHGFIVTFITAATVIAIPDRLATWAAILGISATVLGAIQYLPQIWTTYCKQDVGSLSIPMMLIQTPGSFLWASSLFIRLGWTGWSSWGLFLVTGSLQGCLLVMGISFEVRKRNSSKAAGANDDEHTTDERGFARHHIETDDEGSPFVENGSSERTPLLKGNKNGRNQSS